MKIYIGGDICPTNVTAGAFASGDVRSLFGTVTDLVKDADGFFVNLECAVTDRDTPIRKMGPNLRAPVGTAETLRALGVTAASLSNNHTFDYDTGGFTDTLRDLEKAGIRSTGWGPDEASARSPLFTEICGKRIALVCVCEHEYSYALPNRIGAWGFDPFETMEDVEKAKADADFVVVLYHGGKEQCEVPSPRLRRACRAMVRAGADLVLCQHSHCIGSEETYRGSRIVYGQGNFNFVKHEENAQWTCGLLLEVRLGNGAPEYVWHPVRITGTGITLAEGEEKEKILKGFRERSVWLEDDRWMLEWHRFCEENRDYYTRGITGDLHDTSPEMPEEQLRQFFPHFLDCEAHTDVWRELFPSWHGEGSDEI